jgi:hypothetical protein
VGRPSFTLIQNSKQNYSYFCIFKSLGF